jgi:hypothetical protein
VPAQPALGAAVLAAGIVAGVLLLGPDDAAPSARSKPFVR